MSDNLEKILKLFKQTRLSAEDRAQMRRNLLAFMENSSERKDAPVRHLFWKLILSKRRLSMPVIIVALMVALSGGTVAAASTSLPGEALYPIKVEVAEKMANALKFSSEARAEYGVKLTERRLEEASELAAGGRLNLDLVGQIEYRFNTQQAHMRQMIERLENEDKQEAAARLSANLELKLAAHANVLEALRNLESDGNDTEGVEDLIEAVKERQEVMARMRTEHQGQLDPQFKAEAALNKREAAVRHIAKVEEFIGEAEEDLDGESVAEARLMIETAKELIVRGDEKVEAQSHEEAFDLFQQAHQQAQEAKLMTKANTQMRLRADGQKVRLHMENKSEADVEHPAQSDSDESTEDASPERRRNQLNFRFNLGI